MHKISADGFGKRDASANRSNINRPGFSYSKIYITAFTVIFIIFVGALDSGALGESVDKFEELKFYLEQNKTEIERLKFTSEMAKNEYDKVKTLFDYTKFHIGIYISLGSLLVAAFDAKIFPHSKPILGIAIICIGIAGFAGGIVASTLPESESLKLFFVSDTGPFGFPILPGRCWTHVEHTAFWIGIILGVSAFIFSPKSTKSEPSTRDDATGKSGRRLTQLGRVVFWSGIISGVVAFIFLPKPTEGKPTTSDDATGKLGD